MVFDCITHYLGSVLGNDFVGFNDIMSLPNEIGSMPSLEVIDLGKCLFTRNFDHSLSHGRLFLLTRCKCFK